MPDNMSSKREQALEACEKVINGIEDGTISVNGEEQDSATLIMTNDNTKVFISKQDITTKQELPGAHLVVKDQDGNIVKDGEWDFISDNVKDLIKKCLEKNPEERINIDEFISHPWFNILKKKKSG